MIKNIKFLIKIKYKNKINNDISLIKMKYNSIFISNFVNFYSINIKI